MHFVYTQTRCAHFEADDWDTAKDKLRRIRQAGDLEEVEEVEDTLTCQDTGDEEFV